MLEGDEVAVEDDVTSESEVEDLVEVRPSPSFFFLPVDGILT